MEFDFLPKLPNSNLDDRAFKDLVEECLLRIPRYCPEWTNHNPSDPGITLIELFAWLTDQMQLRFNQVPRRYYVAFLELLGIRLAPPHPAEVNLTFYLSSAQPFPVRIPRDVEVATERTATEEAVVFSTDESLIVGNPRIKHFLTADTPDSPPAGRLRNRFNDTVQEQATDWQSLGEMPLFPEAQLGNCFYLVLDTFATEEAQSIQGNVLELHFQGEAATGTGINPDEPPRVWQAWNGKEWQSILRTELDDHTDGFNFEDIEPQGQEQLREASVILHLPPNLPETDFGTAYRGYWVRCVYQTTREEQPELQRLYSTSPRITGLRIQSIGGTVRASQCIRVQEELIGVSNGKPGQQMQLQMQPVLERQFDQEYLEVRLLGQSVERWQEVKDFGNSLPDSPHYTIDSRTGLVQFGPLIRGPRRLQRNIDERGQYQASFQPIVSALRQADDRRGVLSALPDTVGRDVAFVERQYGKVPPPGAEVYITSYRFGGGKQGNVQAEKLTVLRSALSYISRVTNYEMARGGADADSLEEAVMRVPEWLRTRECAVTPEDFETVVKRLPSKQVARVHCLTNPKYTTPGVVRLLVVPQVNIDEGFDWSRGMHPETHFSLEETATNRNRELRQQINTYLADRRPLGIQVQLQEPEYVGVSVRVQVLLDQTYPNPRDRARAERQATTQLLSAMYQFFNPLVGGTDGNGWRLGRPVYVSDVVALCQKGQGIRHVGAVQLYEIRKQDGDWVLFEAMDSLIEPGAFGLICSWAEGNLSFAPSDKQTPQHEIQFID
jgi:predicted phage baseplate assembly protein